MNGLIAFLDILGYQSFLENNSATDSALNVLELIIKTPHNVATQLAASWQATPNLSKTQPQVAHLIFSDTIVLSLEYTPDADDLWKQTALIYLTAFAGSLSATLFI